MPKGATIQALEQLEETLVNDRDAINGLLRVIRKMKQDLVYIQSQLKRARNSPSYVVLRKAYAAQNALVQEFLEQLEGTSGDDKNDTIVVPDSPSVLLEDNIPEATVVEPNAPSRLQRWSPIAKTIIEAAYSGSFPPETRDDLMALAYGPAWEYKTLGSLPGRWGEDSRTLKEALEMPQSSVRRTVLRGIDLVVKVQEGEPLKVTTDIYKVVDLSKKRPELHQRITSWFSSTDA